MSLTDPSAQYEAVTKSDTANLAGYAASGNMRRALYIGGAGNVACVDGNGVAVTFVAIPAGTTLPVRCKRVNSTNTTATNIVALF